MRESSSRITLRLSSRRNPNQAHKENTFPQKLRRRAVNWEPLYPEGEDEVSMKRNKEALENEWERKTPNQERIQRGMMLTFPD